MSQKNLETSEIINQVKSLNEVIKQKEVEKSQMEGRLATLYERLKAETGKDSRVEARKLLRDKEKDLDKNIARLRELYDELSGREEWKITLK